MEKNLKNEPVDSELVRDLRQLIVEARSAVAVAVNSGLTLLYWKIGKRIRDEILKGKRAEYGQEIVATLSPQLTREYGPGFNRTNLFRMLRFAEAFPDFPIVATVWPQLSWSHFRELLPLEKPLQREFYAEMCRVEGWSVRTLRERIDSMLYERTAISRKPEEVTRTELAQLRDSDQISPFLLLKDPYVVDFLGLNDRCLERDLEDAILREMENFLLELGAGFTFVSRQKRLQIDGDDFYIDLLFFNRKLRRLVALDLKIGAFKPEYKGQMELYLRWLDRYERESDEVTPLGIILCADKKIEQLELLELHKSEIHVAEYITTLPPREILEQKLLTAIEHARTRFESGR